MSRRRRFRPGRRRRHPTLRGRGIVLAGAAMLAAMRGAPAEAQEADTGVPAEVRMLVPRVLVRSPSDETLNLGAGIVLGAARCVYVATARHVVPPVLYPGVREAAPGDTGSVALPPAATCPPRTPAPGEPRVVVYFASGDSALARVVADDEALDALVLVAAAPRLEGQDPGFGLERVGNLQALRRGQGVWAVGCPQGECYEIDDRDQVLALGPDIVFSTALVRGGSSGGGLFDRSWELLGMILEVAGGRSRALPVDQLLAWARNAGVPVSLRPPAVPRSGYRTTVGALTFPFGRTTGRRSMPAARMTVRRELPGPLAWHVGLARLTDRDVAASGAVGGLSVGWTPDRGGRRLRLSIVGEVGLANVQGRFDQGGVFVEDPAGARYRPAWVPVDGSGLGFGVAGGAAWTVAPRIILEALAGFWTFEVPVRAPDLSTLGLALGIRYGFL